jgi:Fe-S-cluster containining protein
MDLQEFNRLAKNRSKANRQLLDRLKSQDPRQVDDDFHELHDAVFAETDCLSCANCCKTTSPIFYQSDIERAARALRMKPGDFVVRYLRIDDDDDYVLQSAPCPFLGTENHCRIYQDRPKACREYPHTDRKKMVQIMDLTYQNTMVCPAVLEIVDRIRNRISG